MFSSGTINKNFKLSSISNTWFNKSSNTKIGPEYFYSCVIWAFEITANNCGNGLKMEILAVLAISLAAAGVAIFIVNRFLVLFLGETIGESHFRDAELYTPPTASGGLRTTLQPKEWHFDEITRLLTEVPIDLR